MFLGGPIHTIEMSLLTHVIRAVGVSLVENQWLMVLPMCISGGESMGTVAMMKYIHSVTPTQVHSTMFTLLSCLQHALGACLSHVIAGWLYDAYGGRVLYRVVCVGGAVWLLVLLVFFHVVPLVKKTVSNYTKQDE